MKRLVSKVALAGAAVTLFGVAGSANALLLTYDDLVTGSTPASGTPWLTSTIANIGGDGVQMTIDVGVQNPEFLTSIFFSLGSSARLNLLADPTTSPDISLDSCGNGKDPADTGPWQLCLSFAPKLQVDSPTSVTFSLLGLHESDFVVNSAGWYSVAHIQGVQPCSAWVGAYGGAGSPPTPGACTATSVPEPPTWSLLGIGVFALLGSATMRRRASIQPSV